MFRCCLLRILTGFHYNISLPLKTQPANFNGEINVGRDTNQEPRGEFCVGEGHVVILRHTSHNINIQIFIYYGI